MTATGRRTVQRGYDAVAADPARIVDGIRPTADTAAAEGLTVTVTWSEAIDPASARNGAGGFVLRYGGSVRPAVTAVAVDGTDATMVRLTVDAQIPDGTADATLAWSPPGSGAKIRDLAGNEPDAFTASGDRDRRERDAGHDGAEAGIGARRRRGNDAHLRRAARQRARFRRRRAGSR